MRWDTTYTRNNKKIYKITKNNLCYDKKKF